MAKRISARQHQEQQAKAGNNRNFPRLSDLLVNLSTSKMAVGESKTVKVRLVGQPISYKEYTDKKWIPNPTKDPNLKGKSERVEFPDAALTKSFTRIGNDDESKCEWKAAGYIGTTKYAQNVLEWDPESKTWVAKILSKGSAVFEDIFKWEIGRLDEYDDLEEDEREDFVTFLGSMNSPCVRIKATKTGEAANKVEYHVSVESKNTPIDDSMVEILRAAGEPSAEEIAQQREIYMEELESGIPLPEWDDVFAYGYDLGKIFKYTPMKQAQQEEAEVSTKEEDLEFSMDDDDDEEEIVEKTSEAKPKKATKSKPAPAPADDDDDEEDDMDWAQ